MPAAGAPPVVVKFSVPVYNVEVNGNVHLSCTGNYSYVVAKLASGAVDTMRFAPDPNDCDPIDNYAGWLWSDTLVGPVIEIALHGGPNPGYEWNVSISFDRYGPCPPAGDSVLDNPAVRKRLLQALDSSVAAKTEFGGYIYRNNTDGTYLVETYPVPPGFTATECTFPMTKTPFALDGYTPVATWHTHPLKPGKSFTNCPKFAGKQAGEGPSYPDDFDVVKATGLPMYIIDPVSAFRLNKDVKPWQKFANLKYKWNRNNCTGWRI